MISKPTATSNTTNRSAAVCGTKGTHTSSVLGVSRPINRFDTTNTSTYNNSSNNDNNSREKRKPKQLSIHEQMLLSATTSNTTSDTTTHTDHTHNNTLSNNNNLTDAVFNSSNNNLISSSIGGKDRPDRSEDTTDLGQRNCNNTGSIGGGLIHEINSIVLK